MLCVSRLNAKHNCNSSLFVSLRHMCISLGRCARSTTIITSTQNAILLPCLPIALAHTHRFCHSTKRNIEESINVDKGSNNNNISTSVNNCALLQNILEENEKIRDLYNSLCEHIVKGNATAAAEHVRMLTEKITDEKRAHDTHTESNNNAFCEITENNNTETRMHYRAETVAGTEPIDSSTCLPLFMYENVKSNATNDDDNMVEGDDDMPSPRHDDVEDAVLAAEREFRRRSVNNRTNCNDDDSINTNANTQHPALATLLTSSKHLCITIIETAFEAIDSSDTDGNADSYSNISDAATAVSESNEDRTASIGKTCGNRELTSGPCDKTESKIDSNYSSNNINETDSKNDIHTRILNEYLTKEATKWKAQKNAIAKVILDTAQRLHITPLSLLEVEDAFPTCTEAGTNKEETSHKNKSNCTISSRSQWRLWKHCNVVVRGELPETAQSILRHNTSSSTSFSSYEGKDNSENNNYSSNTELQRVVDSELEMLKRRLADQGIAFSHDDEHLARVELCLQHCTMRYVIGIHRQLQVALDNDKGLHTFRRQHNLLQSSDNLQSGSEFFIHEVMQTLNSVPSSLVSSFELMNAQQKPASEEHLLQEKHEQKQKQQHNELKQSEEIGNKEHDIYTKNNRDNWQATEDDKDKQLILYKLATPVIPYTFMLKCCLWFDIPRSDLEQ